MDRGWYLRFAALLAAVVFAWLSLWPSIPVDPSGEGWFPPAPELVREYFPGRISPGLDIKGGLRLVYEVDTARYIETQRDRDANRLLRRLGGELGVLEGDEIEAPPPEKIAALRERVRVERIGQRGLRVTFQDEADGAKLTRALLRENFPTLSRTASDGLVQHLEVPEEVVTRMRDEAVQQAEHTIAGRIDNLGLREATVIGVEQDLIVEVPGADESQFDRIRGIISMTAQLEFRILDDAQNFIGTIEEHPEGIEVQSEVVEAGEGNQVRTSYLVARGETALTRLQAYVETLAVPEDRQLLLGRLASSDDLGEGEQGEETWRTYFVHATTDVTGRNIEDAFVSYDQNAGNRPVVSFQMKAEGGQLMRNLTGANLKRRMGVVLDDRVESAPTIQSEIGERGQITLGSYSNPQTILQEAQDLVIVLKAGALDAPLSPANEQMIGPTLGEDSVKQGAIGALVGVILVLIFMAIYYQVAGLVADLMVVLNLLFLLAILAAFEATLTLPGVAAVALTVGMAVDANVLITERIREELRLGKSPRSAVDQGFGRAFSSVFDSQLTTFIAGVVLFQYGSGPIKGFAVMLMIGIATSLFTGIFCSRVILDWIVRGLKVQQLRVG
ncbi:MAG: protein translocase subunit SecD [Myxococcales bacterium]|nr:protein translocase subunit SecD [Myxococcales bacterium]